MKKYKIIFWITTSLLFVTQGLLPLLTLNAPETKAGMEHLGYPTYFAIMMALFKHVGGLILIIPRGGGTRIKEWAYAGFAFDFIAAFVSIWAVDGVGASLLFPTIAMAVLLTSYYCYHRMLSEKRARQHINSLAN